LVFDQTGAAQHLQVLADRWSTDRKPVSQLADRRRAVAKKFQDSAAHGVAERIENDVC
jgi:hypothetical protein